MIDRIRSLHIQAAMRSEARAAEGGPSSLMLGLLVTTMVAVAAPALAGVTTGAEFQSATDDITDALSGFGGLLIALLGGVVSLIAGLATGQVRSVGAGFIWAFVPALILGVITSKYTGLI